MTIYLGGAIRPEKIPHLRYMWYVEKLSVNAIADRLGVTKNTVCGAVRRLNLTPRRRGSNGPIIRDGVEQERAASVRAGQDSPARRERALARWVANTEEIVAMRAAAIVRKPVSAPPKVEPPEPLPRLAGGTCQWTDSVRRPWVFCPERACCHPVTNLPTSWCSRHLSRVWAA